MYSKRRGRIPMEAASKRLKGQLTALRGTRETGRSKGTSSRPKCNRWALKCSRPKTICNTIGSRGAQVSILALLQRANLGNLEARNATVLSTRPTFRSPKIMEWCWTTCCTSRVLETHTQQAPSSTSSSLRTTMTISRTPYPSKIRPNTLQRSYHHLSILMTLRLAIWEIWTVSKIRTRMTATMTCTRVHLSETWRGIEWARWVASRSIPSSPNTTTSHKESAPWCTPILPIPCLRSRCTATSLSTKSAQTSSWSRVQTFKVPITSQYHRTSEPGSNS